MKLHNVPVKFWVSEFFIFDLDLKKILAQTCSVIRTGTGNGFDGALAHHPENSLTFSLWTRTEKKKNFHTQASNKHSRTRVVYPVSAHSGQNFMSPKDLPWPVSALDSRHVQCVFVSYH